MTEIEAQNTNKIPDPVEPQPQPMAGSDMTTNPVELPNAHNTSKPEPRSHNSTNRAVFTGGLLLVIFGLSSWITGFIDPSGMLTVYCYFCVAIVGIVLFFDFNSARAKDKAASDPDNERNQISNAPIEQTQNKRKLTIKTALIVFSFVLVLLVVQLLRT